MFLGMSYLEWSANLTTALCIFLAGRNNIHTWWTGIVSCVLFGVLFYQGQLYADVTLQVFFIATGIIGWINWSNTQKASLICGEKLVVEDRPAVLITLATNRTMIGWTLGAAGVYVGYSALLSHYTNAFLPWVDSMVMVLSIVGQFLLMRRQIQTWPVWVLVNIISVPLYFTKGLYLTSGLYALFLVNALYSWYHWNNLYKKGQ